MRKRVLFAILAGLGAMIMVVFADSNWLLAAIVGVGLGAVVFTFAAWQGFFAAVLRR